MRKYWYSLVVGLKEDTVYVLSVLAWRVRNIMQILVVYILWSSLLVGSSGFGVYSRSHLLTYILLTMVIRTIVFSSRTVDVSDMISGGDLSNFLVKPINFFKYFFSLDLGNKAMNLVFSVFEFSAFVYIFKPPFFLQGGALPIIIFALLLVLATFVYYFINMCLGFLAFYTPENVWAPRFLFFMILDFMAGALFPLDILPGPVFKLLMLTPFPYFLYFPIAVYLGKFTGWPLLAYSFVGIFWAAVLMRLTVYLWGRGLRAYEAWGQ